MATRADKDIDVSSIIAHHDAEISNLGGRMDGVEMGLRSLHGEVHSGFTKVADRFSSMDGSFAKIENLIVKSEAKQGPAFGDLLKIIATGGAIVAMSAAAITMLVQSFISPDLTNLRDMSSMLSKEHDIRITQDAQELRRLREDRKDKIEKDIETLSDVVTDLRERLGWTATVRDMGKGRGS